METFVSLRASFDRLSGFADAFPLRGEGGAQLRDVCISWQLAGEGERLYRPARVRKLRPAASFSQRRVAASTSGAIVLRTRAWYASSHLISASSSSFHSMSLWSIGASV